MRLFSILTVLCCLLAAAEFSSAQERITRADRKAMRETRDTMRSLAQDLRTLHNMNEEYPEELKAVVDNKLRESVPKDAWGREFAYQLSDEHGYELTSWGADGAAGGEGGGRDIVWTPAGEWRKLTDEEKAEQERIRDERRFQGFRVVARARMVEVGKLVVDHRRNSDKWPESLQDVKPQDDDAQKFFRDPWGHDFAFKTLPHENFAVICYGRDGEEAGKGRDADFVITEREVREAREQERGRDAYAWRSYNRDWRLRDLVRSIEDYKERNGALPERLEDLTKGPGPVRNSLPRDQWGNDYVYVKLDEDTFHVIGLGKDQLAGGVGDNKDVIKPALSGDSADRFEEAVWRPEPAQPQIDEDEVKGEIADEVMRNLVEHVNAHHAEHGEYPTALEDIKDRLPGGEVPLDPWENAYLYELTLNADDEPTGFTVTCLGSDGGEGGEGTAADVTFNQSLERTPSLEDDTDDVEDEAEGAE